MVVIDIKDTFEFNKNWKNEDREKVNKYFKQLVKSFSTSQEFRLTKVKGSGDSNDYRAGLLTYMTASGYDVHTFIVFSSSPIQSRPKLVYGDKNTKNTPVSVFYLFNYTDYDDLTYRIHTFIPELKEHNFHNGKKASYYEITATGLNENMYSQRYVQTAVVKELTYPFKKGVMTKPNEDRMVKGFVTSIAQELESELTELKLVELVKSNDSEACYIHIKRLVLPYARMKISIRNHPLNTQSQMVFYLYNYDSFEDLKAHLFKTLKEFDWDNYAFSAYNYYDVSKEGLTYKRVGDDLSNYSKKQLEQVESTRKDRMYKKQKLPLIRHPKDIKRRR